jgi:hypothetical protein
MHCPNCGTAAVKQQKFCRACGFGLEQVAQLLVEAGHALPDSSAPAELDERARMVERWRDIAFYIFAATIVTGLSAILGYGIVYKMMIVKGNVIPGLLLLLFFLGAGALITLQAYAEKLRKNQAEGAVRSANRVTGQTAEALPAAVTTSKLLAEAQGAAVASITEDTTKDLQPHR